MRFRSRTVDFAGSGCFGLPQSSTLTPPNSPGLPALLPVVALVVWGTCVVLLGGVVVGVLRRWEELELMAPCALTMCGRLPCGEALVCWAFATGGPRGRV